MSDIKRAIHARAPLFCAPHETAFRLFNGFTEGNKQFVIDVFGKTAVINDYQDADELTPGEHEVRPYDIPPNSRRGESCIRPARIRPGIVGEIVHLLQSETPFIDCIVLKQRKSRTAEERNGIILFGEKPTRRIIEHNVRYALDITMNRDASFYIDTRNLRQWILKSLKVKSVLNTFAYTGSIGIAAMAAGAKVVQTDLNRTFLNLAKQSCSMNGFPISKREFISGDFFMVMKQLQRQNQKFDCVILDPPFFSKTDRGTVDLEQNITRLINKVRPLVNVGGKIIAVNNAIYVSGKEYMTSLNDLCKDGYISIDSQIDIPPDCTGYPETIKQTPLTDPTPFNHATKIAVLNVKHRS